MDELSGADAIRVVPASPDDVAEIVALVNSAYRGESARDGWTNESELLSGARTDSAMLSEAYVTGPATILLLRDAAGLAGCVLLEPAEETTTWYLGMLTVDPRRQASGMGRALLSAAEDFVRGRGATRVKMTVITLRETLIAWYERRGYRRTGKSEPFPYDNDRIGTPLRDDLRFLILEKEL